MAVTYDLIIIGDTSAEDFVARVYDDALPPPAFEPSNKAQAADENERLGFWLTLLEGRDGYFQDEDWEIEPRATSTSSSASTRKPSRRPCTPTSAGSSTARSRRATRTWPDQQRFTLLLERKDGEGPARAEQLLGRLTKRP